MKLYSVEGNRQRFDGGACFSNAPRAMWEKWLVPDAKNRILLACRGLLVQDLAGKLVLFEAGAGAFFEPKLKERYGMEEEEHVLLRSLKERGFSPEDVDMVVLNHLHFDHVGGILAAWREGEPKKLLFPRARFLVSEAAFARASRPHPRDRASFISELPGLLKDSGRLEIVREDGSSSLGPGVRFTFSQGHTPGLLLAELGGDGGVAYCSDLVPGRPWVHLPITMSYDRFPETVVDEKRVFLDDKIARKMRLFFPHDPECALATPVVDAKGKYGVTDEMRSVDAMMLK